jgi:type I restriction enzyme R subunit
MEKKLTYDLEAIAEMSDGIILKQFEKNDKFEDCYQTEEQLEERFIDKLRDQGYCYENIRTPEDLLANLKEQIEKLNGVIFSKEEWQRFLDEYLNCPNDGMIEKTRKIQDDFVYDFIFDKGYIKNIKLIDKKNVNNNYLQVINQFTQHGIQANRYDVTILVNGLPLVHIELKKRGVNLREAFNQIHRYSKESFNVENSLFKYIQLFVISNGTDTRYFANTTANNKNHYEFTCEWADGRNKPIKDLEDFTETFFEKRVLLEVLTKYCVFNVDDVLLVMRPYQICATERIIWKINSSFENKKYGTTAGGGFIWHTTGSGKTLTSFKTARLATDLPFIKKVFFVVDRKDLDYQTMKEYQKFQKNSVNGSKDYKELKCNIENDDNKIVVTTIQKLNVFLKKFPKHEIYQNQCVLIFDECHRSQFGEAQKNIKSHFKQYYLFGFTGTPIFKENAASTETTVDVFGKQLHAYVLTDAIRDGKVLKFKVDYNSINPYFKEAEQEFDEKKIERIEKKMLMHPKRIEEVSRYILKVFDTKTHRSEQYTLKEKKTNGFNAIFAVQNIDAAKMYYEELKKEEDNIAPNKRLKIATIFSFAQNEEQKAKGEIDDEELEITALEASSKEFLHKAISDYDEMFKTNYSTDGIDFQNYYKDLSLRVKNKEVDLLIVVGMFLTGFDAQTLNTLFVDKNLRYHGLIQAFSRTNRIFNQVKTFGNIICFRDLQKATRDAIALFGDRNSINLILERKYNDYLEGYTDEETGKVIIGYIDLCNELLEKFPNPTEIILDKDKKEFVNLFGELLKSNNILKNYDEFQEEDKIISERQMQDMKSVYIEIREDFLKQFRGDENNGIDIDFSDVEFQMELLKTEEINLDYILALIVEKMNNNKDTDEIKEEIKRIIRSSLGVKSKEDLIIDFINNSDISKLKDIDDITTSFYKYAKLKKENSINVLIDKENLKTNAKRFIEKSIKNHYADASGSELDSILPATSRRNGAREEKKNTVLNKIQKLVDVFVGI